MRNVKIHDDMKHRAVFVSVVRTCIIKAIVVYIVININDTDYPITAYDIDLLSNNRYRRIFFTFKAVFNLS